MNNRDRLVAIIAEHELERREVAELLKVKQEQVDRWLISNESRNHEEMPEMAIELLELKISLGMHRDQGDVESE